MLAKYYVFAKEIYVGNFTFAWCLCVSVFYLMKNMASIFFFLVFEAQFFKFTFVEREFILLLDFTGFSQSINSYSDLAFYNF